MVAKGRSGSATGALRGTQNSPRRPGGGCSSDRDGGGSAADLEDLVAALRAGALKGRLPVLHGDLLRVLNLDLHLVLHAVGLGHRAPPLSCGAGPVPTSAGLFALPEGRPPAVDPGITLLLVERRQDPKALESCLHARRLGLVLLLAFHEGTRRPLCVHGADGPGATPGEPGEDEQRGCLHLEVEDALARHLLGEVRVTDGKLWD